MSGIFQSVLNSVIKKFSKRERDYDDLQPASVDVVSTKRAKSSPAHRSEPKGFEFKLHMQQDGARDPAGGGAGQRSGPAAARAAPAAAGASVSPRPAAAAAAGAAAAATPETGHSLASNAPLWTPASTSQPPQSRHLPPTSVWGGGTFSRAARGEEARGGFTPGEQQQQQRGVPYTPAGTHATPFYKRLDVRLGERGEGGL
jgi:hypothetical protein